MYSDDGHASFPTPPSSLIGRSRLSAFSPVPRRRRLPFYSASSPPSANSKAMESELGSSKALDAAELIRRLFLSQSQIEGGSTLVAAASPIIRPTPRLHPHKLVYARTVEAYHYNYQPRPALASAHFPLFANMMHSFLSGKGDTPFPAPAPFPLSTNPMHPFLTGEGGVLDCRPLLPPSFPEWPITALPPLPNKRKHSAVANGSHSKGKAAKRPTLRNLKAKRIVRVPAISTKVSKIPADGYSWRKYGQKPIKGSLYPRGYYKCNNDRGCKARKRVEQAMDDPSILIVTYVDDHKHEILPEPKRRLN